MASLACRVLVSVNRHLTAAAAGALHARVKAALVDQMRQLSGTQKRAMVLVLVRGGGGCHDELSISLILKLLFNSVNEPARFFEFFFQQTIR